MIIWKKLLTGLFWLLIIALVSVAVIAVSYGPMRPWAIFPKWRTIRRALRSLVRHEERERAGSLVR